MPGSWLGMTHNVVLLFKDGVLSSEEGLMARVDASLIWILVLITELSQAWLLFSRVCPPDKHFSLVKHWPNLVGPLLGLAVGVRLARDWLWGWSKVVG